jgi:tRNA (guanine37-N1)-methyltransferase
MNSENFAIQEPSAVIHFDIFTLFPQMFSGPFAESILKRAQENRLMTAAIHNPRYYTTDRHHICDDTPYGGGGGMVMKPEPIFRAVETVLSRPRGWSLAEEDAFVNLPPWESDVPLPLPADTPVILLSPAGRLLTQPVVIELSQY